MPQHNFTLLVNQTISQQPRPSTTLPVPSPLSGSVTHAPSATPVPSVPLCLYPYPYQSTTPITRQPKHNICCSNITLSHLPFLGVFFGEAFFKAVILTGTGAVFLGDFVFSPVFFDFAFSLLLSLSFALSFTFFSLAFFGDDSAFLGDDSTFFFFFGG